MILPLHAATLKVTTLADVGDGSLRTAIEQANAAGDADIDFGSLEGTLFVASTLPQVTANVRFRGPESGSLTLSGGSLHRLLAFAANSTSSVRNLRLVDGQRGTGMFGALYFDHGCAISNAGSLTIERCRFDRNVNIGGWGGAIYNAGRLSVSDTVFEGNRAIGEYGGPGAGFGWPLVYPGNGAGGGAGMGGAIFQDRGVLHVNRCLFVGNEANGGAGGDDYGPGASVKGGGPEGGQGGAATADGGYGSGGGGGWVWYHGDPNSPDFEYVITPDGRGGFGGGGSPAGFGGGDRNGGGGGGGAGMGAAIYLRQGTAECVDSRFEANIAHGGKGGTAGADSGGGGGATGAAIMSDQADVTVLRCRLVSNQALGAAGGSGGLAYGGALYSHSGPLQLTDSLILSNLCTGGEVNTANPSRSGGASLGGGLGSFAARIAITNCAFIANEAIGGFSTAAPLSAPLATSFGGGLGIEGGDCVAVNVTFSGNRTSTRLGDNIPPLGDGPLPGPCGTGGAVGIAGRDGVPLVTLRFCTVVGNTAHGLRNPAASPETLGMRGEGGGIGGDTNAHVRLSGTIVTGNFAAMGSDVSAQMTSLSRNLIRYPAAGVIVSPEDLVGIELRLSPLQDNGGPWPTHLLTAGSPAIDAATDPAPPPTDQRGAPRPDGKAADLGAVEGFTRYLPTLPELRLAGIHRTDGTLQEVEFTVIGPPSQTFAIEGSGNLLTWTEVGRSTHGEKVRLPRLADLQFYRLKAIP
ncbi:MAG: hypothetical protein JNK85_08610 [Verrucomicrobiales bacterium]|nr:hypothetical protein [Verrucomicrobiales bacterium]